MTIPLQRRQGALDLQAAAARKFLDQKARETVGRCAVPGLGAVLVTGAGARLMATAQGIRKVGATGVANAVTLNDKWFLGSISKPVSGTVMGILIEKGVGNLTWTTQLSQVFPEVQTLPGAYPHYVQVTLEQLMAHISGMHYNPETEPGDQWFPADLSVGLTDANVMERRVKFVHTAVLDEPRDVFEYGGGVIVAAAMFERRTGVRFERLMQTHLFDPLNMDHSGLGVTSPGPLDGPWLHTWSGAHVPHDGAHLPQADFGSHGVAGNYVMSAPDMGRFLRENLTAAPETMSVATRSSVHSKMVSSKSNTSRGGWGVSNPAQPDTTAISHNGDNASSMHADMVLHRGSGWGMAAASNCYNLFAKPAVHDMHNIMATMVNKWSTLFGDPNTPLPESVHPTAALVWIDPDHRWLFARRTSGALMRRRLPLEGAPETAIDFPGGVFTSGVAAASSDGKRVEVMARGTDNQIWRGWSKDSGATWQGFKPIPNGTFMTGPAVAMSADGATIHVVAIGMDRRMYVSRSKDGGNSWTGWKPIGAGIFNSQPALVCRNDGRVLHAFGRGTDNRFWANSSSEFGDNWQAHWAPVGNGIFTSGPAAACNGSASKIHVVGRGTDRAYWRNLWTGSWLPNWQEIPGGGFTSAAAVLATLDGNSVEVVGLDGDWCVRRNRSTNGGTSWTGWSRVSQDCFI
jgi:CubicO group peptidase (beta-lactamase class C family)